MNKENKKTLEANDQLNEILDHEVKVEEIDSPIGENTTLKVLADQMIEAVKKDRTAFFIFLLTGLILFIAAFNYRGSGLCTHEYRAHEVNCDDKLKNPIESEYYPSTDKPTYKL